MMKYHNECTDEDYGCLLPDGLPDEEYCCLDCECSEYCPTQIN